MQHNRAREDVPAFDVHRAACEALAAGKRRRAGIVRLQCETTLRYRLDLTGQSLHVRINEQPWESYSLRRAANGHWSARCPGCGSRVLDLCWVPGRQGAMCRVCHRLVLARELSQRASYAHRADVRAGNSEALAAAAAAGQHLEVIQAAEDEGLLPRQYTLGPTWDRRNRDRAAGSAKARRDARRENE